MGIVKRGLVRTHRRALATLLIVLALAVPQIGTAMTVVKGGQPDIVVVMVDDLGAIDERLLNRLPNIRALFLDGGLRFDSAYSETPLCCPGRAGFLTGQHTRGHGVTRNDARLFKPDRTVATALRDSGYWTVMVGKYFNRAWALDDHTPPGWDRVAMLRGWSGSSSSSWWVQDEVRSAGYFDRFVLDQSVAWLAEAPAQLPLFMLVLPRAPHKARGLAEWEPFVERAYVGSERCAGIEPWAPPDYAWSKRPDGFPMGRICRSLLTVDDTIGALRAEAARAGRNPIWILTSDNGMAWGANGYPQKNVPEAGQLPLYVAGPGVARGATDALVSQIDFGPTIAALGNTSMPWADGLSFEPLLRGQPGGRRWMLEDHPEGGYDWASGQTGPWWGIRTPEWHLVKWRGTHLYHRPSDPWEMHDLAAERPELVGRMSALATGLIGD